MFYEVMIRPNGGRTLLHVKPAHVESMIQGDDVLTENIGHSCIQQTGPCYV